jgi:hypothetical protein
MNIGGTIGGPAASHSETVSEEIVTAYRSPQSQLT